MEPRRRGPNTRTPIPPRLRLGVLPPAGAREECARPTNHLWEGDFDDTQTDVKFFFGDPGDVALAGDFDADGCDTVSIHRPAEGRVYVVNELGQGDRGLGAADHSCYFGNPGDKPFVGDFDGDGVETIGLHRESTGLVYFNNEHRSKVAEAQFIFGDPGDRLICGDWNLSGSESPAVFQPADATFYFRFTNTQGVADAVLGWGEPEWMPLAGFFGHG